MTEHGRYSYWVVGVTGPTPSACLKSPEPPPRTAMVFLLDGIRTLGLTLLSSLEPLAIRVMDTVNQPNIQVTLMLSIIANWYPLFYMWHSMGVIT